MAEYALDDGLAYLAEAFGHWSEAEIQAFLDATPTEAGPDLHPAASGLLVASGFAPRETATGRGQAARA